MLRSTSVFVASVIGRQGAIDPFTVSYLNDIVRQVICGLMIIAFRAHFGSSSNMGNVQMTSLQDPVIIRDDKRVQKLAL